MEGDAHRERLEDVPRPEDRPRARGSAIDVTDTVTDCEVGVRRIRHVQLLVAALVVLGGM